MRAFSAVGTTPLALYVVRGCAFGIVFDVENLRATINKIKRDSASAKDSPRHLRLPAKNGK
jgi:hypothetical protein